MAEVSFGEWLKRQRMGRGLTRDQLAHQIGCAAITLRKIEAEERHPSAQIVERLTEIFNIPLNEKTDFMGFARGDWTKAPSEPRGETPWRDSTRSPRTNVRAPLTSFIGRDKEVADVRAGVDGGAAGVHADLTIARRGERLLLPGQGVVQTKHR